GVGVGAGPVGKKSCVSPRSSEAAAVRNKWGETSTPRVARVILDTNVPRFFLVIGPAVWEEIQRAFVCDFVRKRTGRDWFKYRSMKGLSNLGTRRSSGRRDFVLMLGRTIHQLP